MAPEYLVQQRRAARAVRPKSWRNPARIVSLTLALDETDPERMRPGMRFRGTVEVETIEEATMIPVGAVFRDGGQTVAYRRGLTGWRTVPIELGARNSDEVQVIGGLDPGDVVSLEPRL